jgi:hypothetical protein
VEQVGAAVRERGFLAAGKILGWRPDFAFGAMTSHRNKRLYQSVSSVVGADTH